MKNPVFTFSLLLLLVYSSPASSQTKWFKYEGNPVLDVGKRGEWDETFIHIDRVIIEGSVYRMWYSGGWTLVRTGHATSPDGVTWAKDRLNPVLDVSPGSWDSKSAHRPYVIFTDSTYKMWYKGDDLSIFRIGYASSKDGIVWKKAGGPILNPGTPESWDKGRVGWPSVVGPDSSGGYKMWYSTVPTGKVGYATAINETSWIKYPEPVFWDDYGVHQPRVIYSRGLYEMWHITISGLGYATSLDGIHWSKSSENPVLWIGPAGTWDDDVALVPGDIIFDGQLYHMWYSGNDGSTWRGGYAVSPKEMNISISPSYAYVSPQNGTVRVGVKIIDPTGLSFSAKIKAPGTFTDGPESEVGLAGLRQVTLLELFDDGLHQDSLAGDKLFANSWKPTEEKLYLVDLKLKVQRKDTLNFEMNKATVFTTIGPVTCEGVEFLSDATANPGDTVLVRLILRNQGASAEAQSVTASLSSSDASIKEITESSPTYGDIPAGGTAKTDGYYRISVNPYSPWEKDVEIKVSISSFGIPLWYDTFIFRVTPPWWRTNWAYGLYLLLMVGSIGGTIWYVGNRKLRRRIQRLEQERALERERARISQDMHDEVGATLTEIAILSELAKKKPDEAGKHVQQISERAAEVIDNIGEIVWALNPKNDSLDNVIAHIRRYAVEYLKFTTIQSRFVVPDALPTYPLSGEIRRNLFLVVKEAIHNIVKHSQTNEVTISVMIEKSRLEFSIDDNGKGFSIDERLGSGNGLHNMKKRIEEIGGTFVIESKPGVGTKVVMGVGF
ncbi:MAG: hypothetical protein HY707_07740 [Ignavibacteriae bacterium]|nr:hypothetical protein [Ignavibacteriota bacterium]